MKSSIVAWRFSVAFEGAFSGGFPNGPFRRLGYSEYGPGGPKRCRVRAAHREKDSVQLAPDFSCTTS
jgi:hypothetical protein